MIKDYLNYPEKYVFPFVINEKNKTRTIITYNKSKTKGLLLRQEHQKDIDNFRRNFWDRNSNSFAYHKNVRCVDAINSHLKSNFFIKLDIHHFFESITYENFLKIYGNRFNTYWKETLRSFFYKDNLSIGFVSSPLISDFYMSEFDNVIGEYLETNPFLHYSRYSDDILLSSEEKDEQSLNKLFDLVLDELSKINLEINDKKTKKIELDYSKHNSISFLGLNISKSNNVDNKVTISKRYITFLLFLIEKNNSYNNKCKELCDEINSRVAYLAYTSPISFERFQKKHFYIYGKEYDFVPKKVSNRTQPIHATNIDNFEDYLGSEFEFDIHYKMVDSDTGSVKIPDAISLKRYSQPFDDVDELEIPDFVNVIGEKAFSFSSINKVILPKNVKVIGERAFESSSINKIEIPNSVSVIGSGAFSNTKNLTSITLPKKVTRLKKGTFAISGLKKIEIPENVKKIEDECFKLCPNLTEVKILGPVEVIPMSCFENCVSLKRVTLPNTLVSIERNAFKNCSRLEKIVLPNSLVSLDASAFNCCYSLKKLFIPKSVTDITNLYGLKDITTIEFEEGHPLYTKVNNSIIECDKKLVLSLKQNKIPKGIEVIGKGAFYKSKIESIVIPNNVKVIEEDAFSDCKFLKKVTLPDSVIEIKDGAFSGCVSLKEITLPKNLSILNKKVFSGCFRLVSVKLPEGLKKISDLAFYECRSLSDLVLPDSLVELGYAPFESCDSLKKLELGKSLKKVHEYSFSYLAKTLDSISVSKDNKVFTSMDSNILVTIKNKDLILGCKNSTIPNGVKSIHKKAFEFCNGLKSIDLPDTLERIGENAFYQCNKLKKVKASSIFEIGKNAFSGCSELKEFDLPESLTKIGDECFSNCRSLEEVIFPSSISSIGKNAFNNCSALKKIFISSSINYFTRDWFDGCNNIEKITVDENNKKYTLGDNLNAIIEDGLFASTVMLGAKCTNLTDIEIKTVVNTIGSGAFKGSKISSIVLPEGITEISDEAFCDCDKLESITLPETLEEIKSFAFKNCTSLKSIVIPDSVIKIGLCAFENCENLESIRLPNKNLFNIEANTFDKCKSLVNINLPDSLQVIKQYAFASCERIESITIPENVERIEVGAFKNCLSLKEITIPNNITEIGFGMFYNCTSLEKVQLPDNIKKIGISSFYNCSSLKDINLPESINEIDTSAFEGCKSLTKVKIPSKVNTLDHTFYDCTNLEEVVYPDSLIDLDLTSFINTKIDKLYIPKSVSTIRLDENISGKQFVSIEVDEENENFTSLNSNVICKKENTRGIDEKEYCSLIFGCNNSKIPEGVREIKASSFKDCDKLTIENFPDSIEIIGDKAFYNCSNLSKVVFSNHSKLKKITEKAFYNCNIDKLIVTSSVDIATNAFLRDDLSREIKEIKILDGNNSNKTKLLFSSKEFNIPEGINEVLENAYLGMKFTDTIVLPKSLIKLPLIPENNIIKHITLNALDLIVSFKNCNAIEDINILGYNRYYKLSSDGKALMTKDGKTLLFLSKDGIIPDSVKIVRSYAINPLRNPYLFITSNLENIDMDNNFLSIKVDSNNPYYDDDNSNNCFVKTKTKTLIHTTKSSTPDDDVLIISPTAYVNRSDITTINIGKNVKNIDIKGFSGCTSLKTITVSKDNLYYYNNKEKDEIYSKKSDSLVYLLKKKKEATKESVTSSNYKGGKELVYISQNRNNTYNPLDNISDDEPPFFDELTF